MARFESAVLSVCVLILVSFAAQPEIRFENTVRASGITLHLDNSTTPEKHPEETMTGGVAVLDYNNDGRPDIFFINGAHLPDMQKSQARYWNRLYRNDGNGHFTDVTERAGIAGAGYSMGVAVGDFDNDGNEDVYVTGVDHNQLFHNNGDGTFTDVTERAGVSTIDKKGNKPFSVAAGWFDYNNDGKLDLLVVNYVQLPAAEPVCKTNNLRAYCSPDSFAGVTNILFRNNGDGTFTDVSEVSGISKLTGKGMGVAFADYDGDGFTGIFIANDTFRNLLFHNNRDGTFTELGVLAGVAYNENGKSIAGMGADFRDVDNDGRPEIFVTGTLNDMFLLFRNNGRDFTDVTSDSGMGTLTGNLTGWGNGIFDFDNDGWKDLFTANSAILDNSEAIDHRAYWLPDTVFRNSGKGRFTRLNVSEPAAHRGAAFGDLNGDGLVDVVINNLNGAPELLSNRSNKSNHWLIVDLQGTYSNRDGIGSKLEVVTGGRHQYNQCTTSVGYASSSDRRVHFGLGSSRVIDRLAIIWPSGATQHLTNVAADRVLKVVEPW